jgi:DJ-1/PfpI family protein/flagellar hook capping protein FlgD
MKKLLALVTILIFISFQIFAQNAKSEKLDDSPTVIFHLPDKLGTNINFSIDDFEEYGIELLYTGLTKTVNTCSWSNPLGNIEFRADTLITEIEHILDYDALAFLSSPWWESIPYRDVMNSSYCMNAIKTAFENDMPIWATCAGVRVLAKADILDGLDVSGRANFSAEYISAGANFLGPDRMPVIDHHVITTTRGMYFHVENSEAIIQELEQSNKKTSVKKPYEIEMNNHTSNSSSVIWSKTFGGYDSDGGKDIVNTSDGGFAIAGYTWSSGNGKSDMLLVKTDENGEMQWSKTYGGAGWEYAYSFIELETGGYVLAGYTTSEGEGNKDYCIVKTDATGNEVWTKTFGGNKQDIAKDIIETSDGNLLVFGYTESFDVYENDFYAIKIDLDGNEIWSKTFGGVEAELGRKVLENHNNEYMFLGSTGSFGAGNRDVYLVCTDETGTEKWSKAYGTADYNCGFDMIEINNNGYAIIGHADIHGTDFLDVYYLRIDAEGNQTLDKKFECEYKFYDYGRSIFQTSQGYIAICGAVKTKANRSNDIYMLIIDENADVLWEEIIGKDGSEWSTAFCETNDGNFAVVGHTNSEGEGKFDAYLLKVQNPYVSINSISPNNTYMFPVIPNPMESITTFNFVVAPNDKVQIKILDNNGRSVKSFMEYASGKHSLTWNCSNENNQKVSSGIYHLVMKSESIIQSQKLVVY